MPAVNTAAMRNHSGVAANLSRPCAEPLIARFLANRSDNPLEITMNTPRSAQIPHAWKFPNFTPILDRGRCSQNIMRQTRAMHPPHVTTKCRAGLIGAVLLLCLTNAMRVVPPNARSTPTAEDSETLVIIDDSPKKLSI